VYNVGVVLKSNASDISQPSDNDNVNCWGTRTSCLSFPLRICTHFCNIFHNKTAYFRTLKDQTSG